MKFDIVLQSLLSLTIVLSLPYLFLFIKEKAAQIKDLRIRAVVDSLVNAADQLLKKEDPTGEKRKAFVIKRLEDLNIKVTDYVDALIESTVYNIWPKD